mgnify:CR=1 FL=1
MRDLRVGFFAETPINEFYVVSGDGYETYVFIGEMDRVSYSFGIGLDKTRADGATFAIELVVGNETREVINSQISIN